MRRSPLFLPWLAAAALGSVAGGAHALDAQQERGRVVIAQYACGSCHAIPGIRGASGQVGPPLGKLGRRVYIGGILPNDPQNLARWLLDPPAVNPRTAMPNLGLSKDEAQAAAAYLSTLR